MTLIPGAGLSCPYHLGNKRCLLLAGTGPCI